MTTTYDPFHPKYFVEEDLREEMTRVYDLCHGCRLCFKFCDSFPVMFEYIDAFDDQDAARMTHGQQDHVVGECFNCKLCYVNCPYIPGQSEWDLDFPRLMLRAEQVAHKNGKDLRTKLTDAALAKTDLIGRVASATAPLANAVVTKTGTGPRKAMEKVLGLSAERVLAPYVKQRFSRWFAKREAAGSTMRHAGKETQGKAAIFSTCFVEYSDVGIGHDLVKAYEKNCIECTVPEGQVCCGAPYLHQGDVDNFVKIGRKNVALLADSIRAGNDVVVPQPTCGYILKKDYVDYIGGADARLVAENTYDAAEYLMKVHKAEGTELDTTFEGEVPETTTYHAPCHLRAQNVGLKSRDLLKLTGTTLAVVAECSGIDGTWGLRAENMTSARNVAKKMTMAIEKADSDAIAGDCSLANGGIVLETGRTPLHPLQQFARAYGIEAEKGVK